MAKEQTQQAESPQATSQDGGNGSNGGGHKTAFRAVALAAASGATAIAARKAFSGRQGSGSGQESKNRGSAGGDSLVSDMLTSGWDAAKDSLLPLAENAATSAGEFLAQSGPELVRETLVPRFIAGFESARDADS